MWNIKDANGDTKQIYILIKLEIYYASKHSQ